ncbi:MAG: mechanosensitive ion channel family protein [Acutalibacteraceae bacterium]
MNSFIQLGAYTWFSTVALSVLNAVVVGVVGWLLIKFLLGIIAKFLTRTRIDPLLHTVILSIAKIGLLVLLAISVLDLLGIPTTSIITSLGAVGLAISLAVKDSIATLAGGVVILLLKPFAQGDYVEIDGTGGTVREITMFNTVLNTPDNKRISLPNDSVSKAKIINYSAEPNRRLDLVFTIGYNDDYDKARALIEKVIRDCPLALHDPAPVVRMSGHGASVD